MRNLFCAALPLLFFMLACQDPPPSEVSDFRADKAAIAQAARGFSQAYVDGDIDLLMSYYAEDAAILPGGLDIIDQRDSIRALWQLRPGVKVLRHVSRSERIEIDGDLASDYGYYEGQTAVNGESKDPFYGKYVIVWRRQPDNSWKMYLDMWSPVRR